jgi:hypothetical protein
MTFPAREDIKSDLFSDRLLLFETVHYERNKKTGIGHKENVTGDPDQRIQQVYPRHLEYDPHLDQDKTQQDKSTDTDIHFLHITPLFAHLCAEENAV